MRGGRVKLRAFCVFEEVTWLTVECFAQGCKCGEAYRFCLAGLEIGKVGDSDSDLVRQLCEGHFAFEKYAVEIDFNFHDAPLTPSNRFRLEGRSPWQRDG